MSTRIEDLQAEIEAESVAYILCHSAGLHSGAYSSGYVAHWAGGDPQHIRQTADRVITTARFLLETCGLEPEVRPLPGTVAA